MFHKLSIVIKYFVQITLLVRFNELNFITNMSSQSFVVHNTTLKSKPVTASIYRSTNIVPYKFINIVPPPTPDRQFKL